MSSAEALLIMAEEQGEALLGEVVIDGMSMPVRGLVRVVELATFPRKVTTGDYTRDSDDLLSTLVISDLSGGIGIERINAGTDVNRIWWGTADTSKPFMMALGRLSSPVVGPNLTFGAPLGEIAVAGTANFYVSYGVDVRLVSGDPAALSGAWSLTFAPTGPATAFRGTGAAARLLIPQGANGYDEFDGTTVTHRAPGATSPAAIAFRTLGNQVAALDTLGQVWLSLDGSTWAAPYPGIDPGQAARGMVKFVDRQGSPALHLVSNRALWAFDHVAGLAYETYFNELPPHPYQALASTVFDGRVYVSTGLGVHFYDGEVAGAMGPDRDDAGNIVGLPAFLRGNIVAHGLVTEYNGLYALVRGQTGASGAEEVFVFDEGIFDDAAVFSSTAAQASLLWWTGRGWHVVWTSEGATGEPTWPLVSAGDGRWRLWWGYAGDLWYQDLPVSFENPKVLVGVGAGRFAREGRIELGDFDAGMTGFWKLASSLTCKATVATSTETIAAYYSLDGGASWLPLGTVQGTDEVSFPFGTGVLGEGAQGSQGIPFKKLRFAFDLRRDGASTSRTPILEYAVFSYRKVPKVIRSWQFTVPLDATWGDNSPEAMAAKLESLTGTVDTTTGEQFEPLFWTFIHRDTKFRASMANVDGSEPGGQEIKGMARTISVVEVPR